MADRGKQQDAPAGIAEDFMAPVSARPPRRKPACGIAAIRAKAPCRGDCRGTGRGVAQPGSASVWGTGGRRFKSCRPDQFPSPAIFLIPMNTRRALAFIFCTVTLDVLALGVMIPVLPGIVLGFMDGDTAGAAEMFGVFATVWGLMQVLFSPLLGALSDRFGRRPVILISCLGLGLDYIFMALAPSLAAAVHRPRDLGHHGGHDQHLLRLHRRRHDAPTTAPRPSASSAWRSALGFVLGPAIGGLLGGLDPRLPFWVSAAACLINAAFGWFVLPESLPPEKRMAFAWKRANPLGSLSLLRSHRQLHRAGVRGLPGQRRPPGPAVGVRALCRLSLRLGRDDRRPHPGLRRDLQRARPGASGRTGRRTARAAARPVRRSR